MLTSNISKSAVYSVGDINSKNVNFEIPELTVTVVKNNVASHAATMLTQEVGDLIIKATCNAATATSSSNTLFQAPIRRVKFQGQKLQEIQTGFPKFLEEVGYVMANRQTASTGGTMQILSYSSMKSSSLLNQILGNLGTPVFSNSWTFTAKNTIIPQPLGNIVTALTASKDVRFARSLVSKGVSDVVFVDYYPSGGQGSVFIVQRPKTFDTVTTDYSRATPTIARNNYAFPEYKYSTARSIYASIIRYSISSQTFSKWWTNTTNYTQILGIAAPKMNNATTKPSATAKFTSGFAPLYVYYATMCFSATDSSSVRSKYEILGKIMSTGTTFKSRVVIASTANTRLFEQWKYNLKSGTASEKAVKLKMALNNAWAAHGNGQLELVIPPAKKEHISAKATAGVDPFKYSSHSMIGRSRLYQNKSHYCTFQYRYYSTGGTITWTTVGYSPVGTLYMRGTGYVYNVNGTFFTNGTANQYGETIGFGQDRAWITSGHGNISHNGTNIYIPGGNAYATHGQPIKGMVACIVHDTSVNGHQAWRWGKATMYAVPRRGIVDSAPITFDNAIQIPPEYTTATTTAQNIRLPSGWYAFVGVYNGSIAFSTKAQSPTVRPNLTLPVYCPKVRIKWATDDLPNAYSTYDTVFMAHPHIWADDNGEVHFVSYAKDFSRFSYTGIGDYLSSKNSTSVSTVSSFLSVSWTMANVKTINKNLATNYLDNNCPTADLTGFIGYVPLTYHVLGGLVVNHAIPNRPFTTAWVGVAASNATTVGTVIPDERHYHKVIAWGDHTDLGTSLGSDCGKIPFNGTILGIDNNGKAVVIPDKESKEKHTFKPTPMFTRRSWKGDKAHRPGYWDDMRYFLGTYGMGKRDNKGIKQGYDTRANIYKPTVVKVGKDRDYKDFETVYCNPVCMDMGFNYLGSGNPLVITPFSNTNEKTIYFPQDTVEGGEFRHDGFLTGDLLCLRPNNIKNRMLSVAHIPGGIVSNIAYQTDAVVANGQYVYDNNRMYFLAGDGTLWGSKGQTSSFSLCIDTGRIGYGVDGVKIIQDICFANDGNVRYDGAWRVGRNTTAATMTNPSTLKTSNVFSLEQAHWEEGKDYEYTGYKVDCGGNEEVIIGSESPNMISYTMDIKVPGAVVKEILEPRIMKQAGKEAIMVNAETRFYPQVIPLQDKMLMKISGANTGVYTVLENRIKPDSETPTQKVKLLHYKDR